MTIEKIVEALTLRLTQLKEDVLVIEKGSSTEENNQIHKEHTALLNNLEARQSEVKNCIYLIQWLEREEKDARVQDSK